jgi:hypothetical protein
LLVFEAGKGALVTAVLRPGKRPTGAERHDYETCAWLVAAALAAYPYRPLKKHLLTN